jgi:predicted ArsR family transcriptional regulator
MAGAGKKSSPRAAVGTRTAVLDAVRRSGRPVTVQEIAEELNLHTNSVRFHLSRLLQNGLLHEGQADPDGPGRPRMVYSAAPPPAESAPPAPPPAPAGAPPEGRGYQFLAEMLAGHLAATSPDPQAAGSAVGEAWGRYLADRPVPFSRTTEEESIEQITAILDRAGFSPARGDEPYRLELRTCPFRTVADRQPDVVCAVHLGLMRGVLDEMNAPVEVAGLDQFHAPYPCVARLHAITRPPDPATATADAAADEEVRKLPGWVKHFRG